MHRLASYLIMLALIPVTGALATTYVVQPDGTGDYPTIQAALDACAAGDEVHLEEGTFTGPGNNDIIFPGLAVRLRSVSGNPADCVLDCGGGEHRGVLFLHPGRGQVVEGLTITRGYAPAGGDGGAAVCEWGTAPAFVNCVFTLNQGRNAGAMLIEDNASARIVRCAFFGNIAYGGGGGAVLVSSSSTDFSSCVFQANSAVNGGGVVVTMSSTVGFDGCTFLENEAGNRGGALSCYSSSIEIHRSTFHQNTAAQGGAGSSIRGGSIAFLDRTIVAFGVSGEGILCEDASIELSCCDIFGNAGGDWVGCIADQLGQNGNLCADPIFCDPELGNLYLRADSPCAPGENPLCGLVGAWPVGCPAPLAGACCLVDGSCVLLDQPGCDAKHGVYQGDDTTCDPNPCHSTPTKPTTWGRIKSGYRDATR